jgi:uncharacterized protein YpmS
MKKEKYSTDREKYSTHVLVESVESGDCNWFGVVIRLSLKFHIDENTKGAVSLSIADCFSVVNNKTPIKDNINPVYSTYKPTREKIKMCLSFSSVGLTRCK